jgi:radical SAM protein with 4Fe4S-binding SPASM domain
MVIDINVTSTCNLACTYCSEGFECGLSTAYEENTSVTLQNIEDFMNRISDPKKEIYFWGGEPFVNYEFCRGVMEKYKDNPNYKFFFYTNGVYLKKYLKDLVAFHNAMPGRLNIQVSYDGKPVNDKTRIDKQGNPSSGMVKSNYIAAKNAGLAVKLKSVLTAEHFHLIYEAFLDVIEMDSNYFPTPDMYSQLTEEEFMPRLEALKEGLAKIAKHLYTHKLPPETFGWFRQSRALCAAGINYMSVDLNGDISPCHGCMYKESHSHTMGNIFKVPDIDALIKEKSDMYRDALQNQPLGCQTCDSQFCMKCNAATFEKSSKETYIDKWTDHRANWQVCKVFKQNEVVHYALRKALNHKVLVNKAPVAESCTLSDEDREIDRKTQVIA